jgi:hypothetical protein
MIPSLWTDLLIFALQLRKIPENFSQETVWWRGWATSQSLKWDPVTRNEVGRIAQHAWKREGRKVGKDGALKADECATDKIRSLRIECNRASVQMTSLVLLSIPALEKHRWNEKQISMNFETGNLCQALALFFYKVIETHAYGVNFWS